MSISLPLFASPVQSLATPSVSNTGHGRDLRLDFCRGLALLMIFVDHVSGNSFSTLTLKSMGFADAAEVFVFIAGLTAILAYRKIFNDKGFMAGCRAVFARIRILYGAHLLMLAGALLLAALTIAAGSSFDIITKLGLSPALADPAQALLWSPVLGYMPNYLDILPLYVILLALVPLIIMGQRVHVALPLGVALGVYATALNLGLNLPKLGDTSGWFLNPFSWALLFVCGATVAQLTVTGFWTRLGEGSKRLVTLAAVAYVIFAFLHAAPWRVYPGFEALGFLPFTVEPDKAFLSWHRLLDMLAKAWLVAILLPRKAVFMTTGLGAAISRVGHHSLPSFAAGIFLSLLGSVLVHEWHGATMAQISVTTGGIIALLGLALWFERDKKSLAHRSLQPV